MRWTKVNSSCVVPFAVPICPFTPPATVWDVLERYVFVLVVVVWNNTCDCDDDCMGCCLMVMLRLLRCIVQTNNIFPPPFDAANILLLPPRFGVLASHKQK
jgi:hypothetical protein